MENFVKIRQRVTERVMESLSPQSLFYLRLRRDWLKQTITDRSFVPRDIQESLWQEAGELAELEDIIA